jgi:hypothetical protein
MTIKRTISRALVTATVPAAMLMGASPAIAGDAEKDHKNWVCENDDWRGHWWDHDDWASWKDEHCDDDKDKDKDRDKHKDKDRDKHKDKDKDRDKDKDKDGDKKGRDGGDKS